MGMGGRGVEGVEDSCGMKRDFSFSNPTEFLRILKLCIHLSYVTETFILTATLLLVIY